MDDDDILAPTIPDRPQASGRRAASPPTLPDPRYTLERLLGRGGMGEVWLAQDHRIEREVAIKLMRGDAARDPDAVARFLREARVQGRLDHPAIAPVHDLGSNPDAPYFAMKRLAGTTLEDVLAAQASGDPLAREGWPRRMLLARFVDVCLAIELAHQRGVLHRDLKPANIMLGDFGETYVLDWGLARASGTREGAIRASDLDLGDHVQTVAGALLGTPGYMAPEQIRGEVVDHRADIYALGCVLFEILAGSRAVPSAAPLEAALAAESHRPSTRQSAVADDASVEPVPPELDDLCARATAADPAARVGSARELADEIQRFLDGDRDLARRRELAAAHTAAAAARLAEGGDASRAEAMREAGRAIALDPTSTQAQQLLARLLLEPPRDVPDDVRREIERDRVTATQNVLRTATYAYSGNLLIVPLAKLLGVAGSWPFALIALLLVVQIAACAIGARRTRPIRTREIALLLGLHVSLIGLVAACFGPLFVGPIFAFGALPITLMFPSVYMPKTVFGVHILAMGIPLLLELVGVLPATVWIDNGALVFKPWAVHVAPAVLVGLMLVVIVMQMIVCVSVLTTQRDTQERAQERVHVTAWHLRQLLG